MRHKHLLSITDLSKEEILTLLADAQALKTDRQQKTLEDKIVATCFFEPSTRTRLSFETAALRLGAQVIGFSDSTNTSQQKGESLEDTIRIVSGYADAIVMRHPESGAAARAAAVSKVPVINAGDGGNQHPTQTLLDLFSIKETQKRLDNLTVALVGDLKYGRTIHSLIQAGILFNMEFYLVSPEALSLPQRWRAQLTERGIKVHTANSLEAVIPEVDILYMTRIQKERFAPGETCDTTPFVLRAEMLKNAKPNLKVLHPLPRVDEIHTDVDATSYAYYFQQATNGVPVRQALLGWLLMGQR